MRARVPCGSSKVLTQTAAHQREPDLTQRHKQEQPPAKAGPQLQRRRARSTGHARGMRRPRLGDERPAARLQTAFGIDDEDADNARETWRQQAAEQRRARRAEREQQRRDDAAAGADGGAAFRATHAQHSQRHRDDAAAGADGSAAFRADHARQQQQRYDYKMSSSLI